MHLSYLGDAKIGSEEQHWRGHDYCNYDGFPQVSDIDPGNKVFNRQRYGTGRGPCALGWRLRRRRFDHHRANVPSDGWDCSRPPINKPGWAAKKRVKLAAAEKTALKSSRRRAKKNLSGERGSRDKQGFQDEKV